MTFLKFQQTFSHWPIIPKQEINKLFPNYDRNALTRWRKAGYIEKIRNNYYRLSTDDASGDEDLFFLANRIYQPSYISLQSALAWYRFIPEGVFTVTSVSTIKPQIFSTQVGEFDYKKIKKRLFFGYKLEQYKDFQIKIASPEKTFLDYLYFFPELKTEDDFVELRLNMWEVQERFDALIFKNYLQAFNSKALEKRAKTFLKHLSDYDVSI